MEGEEPPCPSPYPSSSSLLKDVSNFRTPKRPSQIPTFQSSPCQQFFTASRYTPTSSAFRRRPSLLPSSSARSKKASVATKKLKAFEHELSQSSRKAQVKKEQSLKSLAKSFTVWLNFLFENPASCGCDLSISGDRIGDAQSITSIRKGKRDSGPEITIGVDASWRIPKRQRSSWSRDVVGEGVENPEVEIPNSLFLDLRNSLKDVCSFDDLMQRMRGYLSLSASKEIFQVMTQVTKNIDEGRLNMKPHCPIVTDVGLKQKAARVLMSYNSIWLRVGLYIVFGGDSLVLKEDIDSEQDIAFLKMIVDKQFFSNVDLAKEYAYNRKVEGLYRPGYYEKLGNVILKRILLLVLVLDRAKCQSCLPLKFGIDGLDGGSPLLFNSDSCIKSSSQVVHEFLSSDVMRGEGNLLVHLLILGYKVSHQQGPLVEYDFKVTDLFVDLHDGVRLCRAIQLLRHDSSILTNILIPSDNRKKNLTNCGLALQHLRQAGVLMNDEDGMMIEPIDISDGDKELTLSLLWNIFTHLQLPLLAEKTDLAEEILKIRGACLDKLSQVNSTSLEMLLIWLQAICRNYNCEVKGFHSLVDGKAIWCLLDYYFRKELHCSGSPKNCNNNCGRESIMSVIDYPDAVHNFILSQKLTSLLGNFPEVLQISDLLEHNGACNERSVVILLAFLANQLFVEKNVDLLNFHKLLGCNCRILEIKHLYIGQSPSTSEAVKNPDGLSSEDAARKFKAIQAWWRGMAEQNNRPLAKEVPPPPVCSNADKANCNLIRESAATVIQSNFRRLIVHRNYLKMINSVYLLQNVFRVWLYVKQKPIPVRFGDIEFQELSCESWRRSEIFKRYAMLVFDRHGFLKMKRSVLVIQGAARNWITGRHKQACLASSDSPAVDLVGPAIIIQKFARMWISRSAYCQYRQRKDFHLQTRAAAKIQLSWERFMLRTIHKHFSATKIQSYFRGWLLRRRFLNERQAITKIQSVLRMFRCWKSYQQYKITIKSAIIIQSSIRGWISRKEFCKHRQLVATIQSHCYAWLIRRDFLFQRDAAIKIQSAIRSLNCQRDLRSQKEAAMRIQCFAREHMTQKRLIESSGLSSVFQGRCILNSSGGCFKFSERRRFLGSVTKLQRWWKSVLLLKLRIKSAVTLQSHVRGWLARRKAKNERHSITVIQSYWKGYCARKESHERLLDLRLRVQKSARNVDDGKRIINRLLVALQELLSMKSVSGILHTCATLNMATEHSQRCCEELVAAGAISKLLKLIRSVSRSIPDQEVLKHALSTLRNLARYPHLLEVLIDSHGSVETILWQYLRNKEDGYFIAADLMKKICSNHKGVEAVHTLPSLVKRLCALVDELTRKASNAKRHAKGAVPGGRENTQRKLKEAAEILKMTSR